MTLLFKMQKTLVTFSITSMLKVRVLDNTELSRKTEN